jgi:hypothetical protein
MGAARSIHAHEKYSSLFLNRRVYTRDLKNLTEEEQR